MKTEKIEKHMRKRTVVRGQDTASTVFGVITEDDGSTQPLRVDGCLLDGARNVCDYDWFHTHEIRKATDDERAALFAWLVSDGTDISDGFARFGGAPRGFEEWRKALLLGEPAPEGEAPKPTPEPVEPEPPAPKHKRGDLRVWLRRNGIGAVARVTEAGHGGVGFAEYKAYPDDAVYEPTRENVAMLVVKQRERGVEPELGDLVYVMGRSPLGMMGRIAFVVDDMGSEMTLARTADVPLMASRDHLILVIRRNPLRELGDE